MSKLKRQRRSHQSIILSNPYEKGRQKRSIRRRRKSAGINLGGIGNALLCTEVLHAIYGREKETAGYGSDPSWISILGHCWSVQETDVGSKRPSARVDSIRRQQRDYCFLVGCPDFGVERIQLLGDSAGHKQAYREKTAIASQLDIAPEIRHRPVLVFYFGQLTRLPLFIEPILILY